jgi:hypothetical protein
MSHASTAEQQKCTSSQATDMFGMHIGDGELLIIGTDEAKALSTPFTDLRKAFRKVAPGDAETWLVQHGAVRVPDGGPITQTIRVVSKVALWKLALEVVVVVDLAPRALGC